MNTLFSPNYNPMRRSYWLGSVDGRPLGAFRILFGLFLFKDALYQLPIAEMFFSDSGVLPRWALYQGLARVERFSLMDSLGPQWLVIAFFIAWAIVAACFTVGWRTRTMAILNFVFILSVHERDPWLNNAADTIMRVLSFWALFIPLGQSYALDSVIARWRLFQSTRLLALLRAPGEKATAFAFPVRMLQIQIALIYVFTSVLKIPGDTWRDGEAIYRTLQLGTSTLPAGDWLLAASPLWVMQILNYFTLFVEWSFFPLVFSPFSQPASRILGLTSATALHVGIAILMSVPNFLVLVAGYVTYFEATWMESACRALRKTRQASTVAPAVGRHPLLAYFALTREKELALVAGPGETYSHYDTWWIADERGRRYQGVPAWARLVGHLPLSHLWWWIVWVPGVRGLLWRLAGGRGAGQSSEVLTERPPVTVSGGSPELVNRRWLQDLTKIALVLGLGSLMGLVMWWNLASVTKPDGYLIRPVPKEPAAVVQYLGLWQQWGMFSPNPPISFGNIIIPARFEDGTAMDLIKGMPSTGEWRRSMWGPTARNKLFEEWMSYGNRTPVFQAWSSRLCRAYNDGSRAEGHRLAAFDFKWRYQMTHAPGAPETPPGETQLWHHRCIEQDPRTALGRSP